MVSYDIENNGYKYILCIIDCFTKFEWTIPLKSRIGVEVTTDADKIFELFRKFKYPEYK